MNGDQVFLDCRVAERSATASRLVVVGDVDLLTIEGFRRFLRAEVEQAAAGARIDLDLSAVTHFCAAATRALVEADEAASARAVEIRLFRVSPMVDLVLRACGERDRFPALHLH